MLLLFASLEKNVKAFSCAFTGLSNLPQIAHKSRDTVPLRDTNIKICPGKTRAGDPVDLLAMSQQVR